MGNDKRTTITIISWWIGTRTLPTIIEGMDDGTQYIDRRAISFYGDDSISGNGSDNNVVVVVYTVVALN